jgi:hypothetical protein
MVLLESPTNPMLKIADIKAIVNLVRQGAPVSLLRFAVVIGYEGGRDRTAGRIGRQVQERRQVGRSTVERRRSAITR